MVDYFSEQQAFISDGTDEFCNEISVEFGLRCTHKSTKATWDDPADPAEFEVEQIVLGGEVLLTRVIAEGIFGRDLLNYMIEAAMQEAVDSGEF